MKKILALILALACSLSLFACKKNAKPAPTTVPTQVPTQTPTTAPTQVPTEAPTETEAPTAEPTEAPTEAPTEKPTQKPTKEPTKAPTKAPTTAPATAATTAPTQKPVAVVTATKVPTKVTTAPTKAPTVAPTAEPTEAPTEVPTQAPTTAPTQPSHTHSFGDWVLQALSTCTQAGREERRCGCGYSERRDLPLEPHKVNDQNVCKTCLKVTFDDSASLVELGVVTDSWYGSGVEANYVWDVKYWNGKIYRGAGDYGKNSGDTTILAYNIATQSWEKTGTAKDEAIHGFVEIGGTLVAPGVDSTGGWKFGNFYVLQGAGTWQQVRNLPNGVHCFDMLEHDGKIFAGLGTETIGQTVAVSEDGGKTFTFAPLYKDGKIFTPAKTQFSRTYELVQYNGSVYALVYFHTSADEEWVVFRYEDGKMHYLEAGYKIADGYGVSRKYFGGEFEFGGACYIASGKLNVITDFSDPASWQIIKMPNSGKVSDVILKDNVIYVLSSQRNEDMTYHTVIYKSATGAPDSFVEVCSYDYGGFPISFDCDDTYFYIGTGNNVTNKNKSGMLLRVKPH